MIKEEGQILDTADEFLKFLCAIRQNYEIHSLLNKEYEFKYVVEKSKSLHKERTENDEKHIYKNSPASLCSQGNNIYNQTLLDEGQFFKTLLPLEEKTEKLYTLFEQNKKSVPKYVPEVHSAFVYSKQDHMIQDNNHLRKTNELSVNVESQTSSIPRKSEVLNKDSFLRFESPQRTEYTFKFVREKNENNGNILKKVDVDRTYFNSLNSCHTITSGDLSLNAEQMKQATLPKDKRNSLICSTCLEKNYGNICTLKTRRSRNATGITKDSTQAKKPKLNMKVDSLLKNSMKNFYGVSKNLVGRQQIYTSTNESIPVFENSGIFGRAVSKDVLKNVSEYNNQTVNASRPELEEKLSNVVKSKSRTSEEISQALDVDDVNKEVCSKHYQTLRKCSSSFLRNTQTVEPLIIQGGSITNRYGNSTSNSIRNEKENTEKDNKEYYNLLQQDINIPNNSLNSDYHSEVFQLPIENIKESQDAFNYHDNNNFEQIKQRNNAPTDELMRKLSNCAHGNSPRIVQAPNVDSRNEEFCLKHCQNLNEITSQSLNNTETTKYSSRRNDSTSTTENFLNLEKSRKQRRNSSLYMQNGNYLIDKGSKVGNNSSSYDTDVNNNDSQVFQLPFDYLQESQDKLCSEHTKQSNNISSQEVENKLCNDNSQFSQEIFATPNEDDVRKDFCSKHCQNSLHQIKTLEFRSTQDAVKNFENLHMTKHFNMEEQSTINAIQTSNDLRNSHKNNNSLCCGTDSSNILSEDFKLSTEHLRNSQEKIDNYASSNSQNFNKINRNINKIICKKSKTKKKIVGKNKSNRKSSHSKNTLISTYYKCKKLPLKKSQTDDLSNDKGNTKNVDIQDLIGCLDFENEKEYCRKAKQEDNMQTNNRNSDTFELLYQVKSSYDEDISTSKGTRRNINNTNIEDNKNNTTSSKTNTVLDDIIEEKNLLDFPRYFSSQASMSTFKQENCNGTQSPNLNSFDGESLSSTNTTVYNNSNSRILEQMIPRDISNSMIENALQSTANSNAKIRLMSDFIENKLRNIRNYFCRCQTESNKDCGSENYINKVILNSLSNPLEDTLLDELQSQELFSQSLTFTPVLIDCASMRSSQFEAESNNKLDVPKDRDLMKAIDDLSKNKSLICQSAYEMPVPTLIKKIFILRKVSDLFTKLLDDIRNHRVATIKIRNQTIWENCNFSNNFLVLKPIGKARDTRIKQNIQRSTTKFDLIVYILGKITDLLIYNETCTKRELYYEIIKFVNHQNQINLAVDSISCLLDEPPWDFGILATKKGLVYGDLCLVFSENEVINCNIRGGSLIPQDQSKITKFVSNAAFILVVEKDTVFQKLLDEDLPNSLPRTFIMITGKGFSDVNTRLFIKKLWQVLSIPVLALVDADPHGIEIMLTYRFGSLKLSHLSEYLALPSLRWIGIHPKEIVALGISHQPLTVNDTRKIQELLTRPYIHSVPKIKSELETMLANNFKAEIEGAMKSNNFLRNFYIPSKLYAQDYF